MPSLQKLQPFILKYLLPNHTEKIPHVKFCITSDEIEERLEDLTKEGRIGKEIQLTSRQTKTILDYIECDEFLSEEIANSIRTAILDVLDDEREKTPLLK